MRIGLSTTLLEPICNRGRVDGIGTYTRALLEALPGLGCTVEGQSFAPPLAYRPAVSVGNWMPSSFAWTAFKQSILRSRSDLAVDLFHATDFRVLRTRCPSVATLHDALPVRHPQWYPGRWLGAKRRAMSYLARQADHVIALTHAAARDLVAYFGVDEQRISVVPCGVDEHWLILPDTKSIDATLQRHGLTPGYFLFVGTFQPRKNIERILEAYLSLPERIRRVRALVLVGRPGWGDDALVRGIAAAVQNGERVHWFANIHDGETLRHLYCGSGAFVFPSLYEGFGIPVIEAFACRTPVITSNEGALAEVAGDAAYLVDPTSSAALAAGMIELIDDERLRTSRIAVGVVRAEEFTWRRCAEKTVAVYRAVLGETHAHPALL